MLLPANFFSKWLVERRGRGVFDVGMNRGLAKAFEMEQHLRHASQEAPNISNL